MKPFHQQHRNVTTWERKHITIVAEKEKKNDEIFVFDLEMQLYKMGR
jgi:hypothetical protein